MTVTSRDECADLLRPQDIAQRTSAPISLRALKTKRRYWVRDWLPSDGPFPGWHRDRRSGWHWAGYWSTRGGEYTTIIRLRDHQRFVFPTRWFVCDPSGLPRDTDEWAEAALSAIRVHYEEQARWMQ